MKRSFLFQLLCKSQKTGNSIAAHTRWWYVLFKQTWSRKFCKVWLFQIWRKFALKVWTKDKIWEYWKSIIARAQ